MDLESHSLISKISPCWEINKVKWKQKNTWLLYHFLFLFISRSSFSRQCSECDQASSDEADIAMETLPDGTKRSRRQIKGPIKFIPQEMSPEPKKLQVRGTVSMSISWVHWWWTCVKKPILEIGLLTPLFPPAPQSHCWCQICLGFTDFHYFH